MANWDEYRPPEKGKTYRFTSGTTHTTTAWPDALKERMVTIHCYLQDVFILFGSVNAASSLEVDRAIAATNAVAQNKLGLKMEKDHPGGYRFYIPQHFKYVSVESSASAYCVVFPSGSQQQLPGDRSLVGGS